MIEPNFDRLRTVLLRAGEPDYVPLGDISVHPLLKAATLGRPVQRLEDEVAFWSAAGYDHVPVEQGLQLTEVIRQRAMQELEGRYAPNTDATQRRTWAAEGRG